MKLIKKLFRTAALVLAALLCGAVFSAAALEKRYEGVYQNTVRLHILAESDSQEDQRLKLLLRDELLTVLAPLLDGVSSRHDARRILEEHLPALDRAAEEFLASRGKPSDVSVTLGEEYYPTRTYENYSFPAGNYLSLRVSIGKAEGKNWWCVVWPPLCLSASSLPDDSGYSDDEQALLKKENNRYEVRFFFLDLLGKLKKKLF